MTVYGGPEIAQPARAQGGRDRYFDLLRALAMVRVVAFHMFSLPWLSMIFPSMGVMFALGGSLMARSVDRNAEEAITGRLRRLLPAMWVVAAVLVPLMLILGWPDRPDWPALLLWLVPLAEPPAVAWAEPVTGILWYIVTYLWLVLLSPVLLRVYRRARLAAVILPPVLLAVLEYVPLPFEGGSALTDILTFVSCWILGFAHRDGDLRRLPAAVVVPVSALCVAAGLIWTVTHPGDEGVDLATVPVAYAVFSAGFVLVLLRFTPPMGRLSRHRALDASITFLNARAVTIYLWHNTAITLSFWVGDRIEVWDYTGDRAVDLGYFAVALALLAVAVSLFGWVEDVAARRRIRWLPTRAEPSRPRPVTPEWSGPII